MKTLIAMLFGVGLAFAMLHLDFMPWQMVSKDTLNNMSAQIANLEQQLQTAKQQQTTAPAQPGSWMWDPNHKTILDSKDQQGNFGH